MKAFILDRDGVINKGGNINKKDQFILLDGVPEAIRQLNDLGFEVFVASNQGGVGLHFMTAESLEEITEYMLELIKAKGGSIREVRYCTHKPRAGCSCRKPAPGMLNELIKKYHIDRSHCFMVGDRDTDIQAGKAAKVRTVYLGIDVAEISADYVFPSLHSAVIGLRAKGVI